MGNQQVAKSMFLVAKARRNETEGFQQPVSRRRPYLHRLRHRPRGLPFSFLFVRAPAAGLSLVANSQDEHGVMHDIEAIERDVAGLPARNHQLTHIALT